MKRIVSFLERVIFSYVRLSLALAGAGFVLRLFEWAALSYYKFAPAWELLKYNLGGFGCDILEYLAFSVVLFPVFLLFYLIKQKLAEVLYKIAATAAIIVSFALIIYFSIQHTPLTQYVFHYSFSDILFIINSSNSSPCWFYCFLALAVVAFFLLSKKTKREPRRISLHAASILFMVAVAASCLFYDHIYTKRHDALQEYYTKRNKLSYFISSLSEKTISLDSADIEVVIEDFQSKFPYLEFVNPKTPFLHKANYQDVLSPFFNLKQEKPNLVFIVVEGLGTMISGDYDNTRKSYTPFLDSLSDQSLVWRHCYTSSKRTFMLLSSLFGPILCSDIAFAYEGLEYISLLKELYRNGYVNNSFFYGGDLKFDKLNDFCSGNHIDNVIRTWDADIQQQASGNKWGIDDHLMFRQAMRQIDFDLSPRIDIYLTVSTHEPFIYPDREEWAQKADNSKIYGSFMYVDHAISELFDFYRNSPEFDNTIFIITGDHLYDGGKALSSYQAPLIISSPMLKAPKRFEAVALQREVTPSLLSLFKHQYHADLSENVTWLGGVLDTSKYYKQNVFTPLVPVFGEVTEMMDGKYYYNGNLFLFSEDNTLTPIENSSLIQDKELFLQEYRLIEKYIFQYHALIPQKGDDRERFIQARIAEMKRDSLWLRDIEEKAINKGVPLDTALRNDAIWIYEQNKKK